MWYNSPLVFFFFPSEKYNILNMVLFIVANYKNINYNSNNKILEF